ncbi:MAG: type IV pilus assembly protein PilM [bacterium]|nr:type IV pilus assembly protein PilM [bacterium]
MNDKAFGLDIGSTSLKAVLLSQEKDGYLLRAAGLLPAPPKGMLSDAPIDQETMAKAIRTLVQEAKITSKFVNVSLAENRVYTKVIEMPVLSDKELTSAIYWEAEQSIPVPLNEITFDYVVLKRPAKLEEGANMQVLLVGAPTQIIDKYNKILTLAGLTVVSVETELLATIRALSVINLSTSIIVSIGAVGTSLAIVKEGIVVFTYFVPIAGVAMTRAIASDFGFEISQAEQYKQTYGYSSHEFEGKIGKSVLPILNSILTEVKKAISFYAEKYQHDTPITQIILSGGSSKLPGIDSFFVNNCGIETITGNPWKVVGSQQIPKEMLQNGPEYTVAIGLAMKMK